MIIFVGEKFSIEHNIINMFYLITISQVEKMVFIGKRTERNEELLKPLSTLKKERNDYNSKAEKILLYKGDVTSEIVGLIEYTARGVIFLA